VGQSEVHFSKLIYLGSHIRTSHFVGENPETKTGHVTCPKPPGQLAVASRAAPRMNLGFLIGQFPVQNSSPEGQAP